jgi:hypothetical protein
VKTTHLLLKLRISAVGSLEPELAGESRLKQIVHRQEAEDNFEDILDQQHMQVLSWINRIGVSHHV